MVLMNEFSIFWFEEWKCETHTFLIPERFEAGSNSFEKMRNVDGFSCFLGTKIDAEMKDYVDRVFLWFGE